ncbi:uncharacterized protein LOC119396951 isoform X2 [Rhipicephalus sanguineus]|uniref:uncharacterized protein LOC119396951 isoform X2 n=1 Tax=Rhipicephalus sanguineus TaxID=34632 RepID=UPI0020C51D8F|nr:uncharacterized protein LOC119396951 isoform X2 [Rhipicephalus sanguineus]
MMHTQFWVAAAYALLAPLFPALAVSRGLEAWEYGFVFSLGKITTLIGSSWAKKLGFLYFSLDTTDISKICISHWTSWILPGKRSVWVWGYPASFFVMSSVFMLSSPFIATSRIFRRNRKPAVGDPQINGDNAAGETHMKHYWLLRDARFISYLFNLFLDGLIFGFIEPTLEPYLDQFDHSSSGVGSVFSVYSVTFCIASAVCGVICHCKAEIRCLPLVHLFNILGFLLIGPAPFLPFKPNMNFIYVSQALLGAGVASLHALSYSSAIKRAIAKGYKEDIDTSSFVCGAIFASYVVGATLSPPISGYVVEALGFRVGSMILFGVLVAWMPALLLLQKNSRSAH